MINKPKFILCQNCKDYFVSEEVNFCQNCGVACKIQDGLDENISLKSDRQVAEANLEGIKSDYYNNNPPINNTAGLVMFVLILLFSVLGFYSGFFWSMVVYLWFIPILGYILALLGLIIYLLLWAFPIFSAIFIGSYIHFLFKYNQENKKFIALNEKINIIEIHTITSGSFKYDLSLINKHIQEKNNESSKVKTEFTKYSPDLQEKYVSAYIEKLSAIEQDILRDNFKLWSIGYYRIINKFKYLTSLDASDVKCDQTQFHQCILKTEELKRIFIDKWKDLANKNATDIVRQLDEIISKCNESIDINQAFREDAYISRIGDMVKPIITAPIRFGISDCSKHIQDLKSMTNDLNRWVEKWGANANKNRYINKTLESSLVLLNICIDRINVLIISQKEFDERNIQSLLTVKKTTNNTNINLEENISEFNAWLKNFNEIKTYLFSQIDHISMQKVSEINAEIEIKNLISDNEKVRKAYPSPGVSDTLTNLRGQS